MTQHALTTLSNTTATRLTPNGVHSGIDITLQNVNATAYVYIGGADVSTTNYGYRIAPDNAWSVELPGQDANLDTGTTTINSYSPVWSGTGLTYTNTPATGSYIKIGNLVTVQIDVLFTTVTNFGTGQYSLTLPFPSKYHTDVYGGSVHKITNQGTDHYSLKGHLSDNSSTFTVWAIGSSAADQTFNNNTPVGIDTDDKFHMSFSYICE